jgi:hypothetical protein
MPGVEATQRRVLNVLSFFEPALVSEKDCQIFYPTQHEILEKREVLEILAVSFTFIFILGVTCFELDGYIAV